MRVGLNWAHELKYDGYRIYARFAQGGARLLTRTGLDWTDRYQRTALARFRRLVRATPISMASCARYARMALLHSPNSKPKVTNGAQRALSILPLIFFF
jgi:hypothetical protein